MAYLARGCRCEGAHDHRLGEIFPTMPRAQRHVYTHVYTQGKRHLGRTALGSLKPFITLRVAQQLAAAADAKVETLLFDGVGVG